jgi:predicted dehydrogenase
MGLTHLALFNLLTDFGVRWTIVEPSRLLRIGMRQALPSAMLERCVAKVGAVSGAFDFAVITSPTTHHQSAYAAVRPLARKIFVEKPLAVEAPSPNTLCGYVLLHHPLHLKAKAAVGDVPVNGVELSLKSNTILGPNTGWRGRLDQGGGVLNEFGSHILSLLVDAVGPVDSIAIDGTESVHSVDAPDRARLSGLAKSGVHFALSLDWTDPDVRKPTYGVRLKLAGGGEVAHDFYELHTPSGSSSVADLETRAVAYLRGVEFTNQAQHFLDNDDFAASLAVAVEVDRILGGLRAGTR